MVTTSPECLEPPTTSTPLLTDITSGSATTRRKVVRPSAGSILAVMLWRAGLGKIRQRNKVLQTFMVTFLQLLLISTLYCFTPGVRYFGDEIAMSKPLQPRLDSYTGKPLVYACPTLSLEAKRQVREIMQDRRNGRAAKELESVEELEKAVLKSSISFFGVDYDFQAGVLFRDFQTTPTAVADVEIIFPSDTGSTVLQGIPGECRTINGNGDTVNDVICRFAGKTLKSPFFQVVSHLLTPIGRLPSTGAPAEGPQLNVPFTAYYQPFFRTSVDGAHFIIGLLPLLLITPFAFLIQHAAFDQIAFKETRLKEIAKAYGLTPSAYWLSTVIVYAIFAMPITAGTCGIIYYTHLLGSNPNIFMVSATVYFYVLSVLITGLFISVFCRTAHTVYAVAVVFNLLFYGGTWLINNQLSLPRWAMFLTCICSTIPYTHAIKMFATLRPSGGATLANMFDENFIGGYLILLIFDCILYATLAWYFDQTYKISDEAVTRPWYFIFECWLPGQSKNREVDDIHMKEFAREPHAGLVETLPEELARKEKVLSVRSLRKVYNSPWSASAITAIQQLDLDVYSGEIVALIGHNGAGKTTLISMLSGLLRPSGGDAMVKGLSISKDPESAGQQVSVCPQENCFFEDLTVREHLVFFGGSRGASVSDAFNAEKGAKAPSLSGFSSWMLRLMGMGGKDCYGWPEILEIVRKVDLMEKLDSYPSELSEGMKRRLWLAISLIGDPSVVLLDEPTCGVDPLARQQIWQILREEKATGRAILLTTHNMEEADVLAGRKMVIVGGVIRCIGSSLFLKNQLGVGYNLTVQFRVATENKESSDDRQSKAAETIYQFVKSYIDSAKLTNVEVSHPRGGFVECQALICLPKNSATELGPMLGALDERKAEFCVSAYSISLTTLEEIFLRFAEVEGDSISSISELARKPRTSAVRSQGHALMERSTNTSLVGQKFSGQSKATRRGFLSGVVGLRFAQIRHSKGSLLFNLFLPIICAFVWFFIKNSIGYFVGSADSLRYTNYDKFFTKIPYVVTPGVPTDALSRLLNNYPVAVREKLYKVPLGENMTNEACAVADLAPEEELLCQHLASLSTPVSAALIFSPEDFKRLDNRKSQSAQEKGTSFQGRFFVNPEFPQAIMSFYLAHFEAIAADHVSQTRRTQVANSPSQPLNGIRLGWTHRPIEAPEELSVSAYLSFLSLVLTTALGLIPQRLGLQMLYDRRSGTKHSLVAMGLPLRWYWIGDLVANLGLVYLANIIAFAAAAIAVPPLRVAAAVPFLLIGCIPLSVSCLLWAYAWGTLVTEATTFTSWFITVNMVIGSIVTSPVFYFFDLSPFAQMPWALHIASSFLFPPYGAPGTCFGILAVVSNSRMNRIPISVLDFVNPYGYAIWPVLGSVFVSLILFWRIISHDSANLVPKQPTKGAVEFLQKWKESKIVDSEKALAKSNEMREWKDEEVKAEESRTHSAVYRLLEEERAAKQKYHSTETKRSTGGTLPHIMFNRVHQVYTSRRGAEGGADPSVALGGVSYCVDAGETFVLLGPNGAGKSTLVNSLICQFGMPAPTQGEIYVGGHNISKNATAVFPDMGICPQYENCWMDITVEENLKVLARIKGVPSDQIQNAVERHASQLGLTPHLYKTVAACSGGNKRRLSVAMAFIGSPKMVVLDEPTSGVDPLGRRKLADIVTGPGRNQTILSTTHTMEEAELLGNRIGILVNGELNTIGSPLAVKSAYGKTLRLEIRIGGSEKGGASVKEVDQFVRDNISPLVSRVHYSCSRLSYDVPLPHCEVSRIFTVMERNSESMNIVDFAVSEPTLEQVFLQFAARQNPSKESEPEVDASV